MKMKMNMINIRYIYRTCFAAAVLIIMLTSCEEDPTDDLMELVKEDKGYVPKISAFTMVTPAATVPAGSSVTLDLRYWSEGTINNIQFWTISGGVESQVDELPYAKAYSKVTRTDSLRYNYVVPADLVSGTTFSLQARVTNAGLEEYPTKSALINLKVQ
jgi:hypothetical protein